MSKVTKAIFCVAGFGTRFLPATKAQPKEMLPLVDKPIIQYLVEEAVEAGIHDIIFVTGRGKSTIENHFDKSFELEYSLVEKGKHELVEEVDRISKLANFAYVRQPVQKGDGHALLCAKPYVDLPEPVLVVFPDYYMPSTNNTFKRMIKAFEHYGDPVIATDFVAEKMVPQYGAVMYEDVGMEHTAKISGFVEKPKYNQIPEGLVKNGYGLINNGYAIINYEVWDALQQAESTVADGEIRVADAFVKLLQAGNSIYAVKPIQHGYDCGNKIGFLKATVDLALERTDLGDEFKEFLEAKFK